MFTRTCVRGADEISIFEPPVKNSGRTGGKFMERCKVRELYVRACVRVCVCVCVCARGRGGGGYG